jgi:hypothetical protein
MKDAPVRSGWIQKVSIYAVLSALNAFEQKDKVYRRALARSVRNVDNQRIEEPFVMLAGIDKEKSTTVRIETMAYSALSW